MTLPYTTAEEFNQRLQETVILLDGLPIYVQGVATRGNQMMLQYYSLPFSESGRQESAVVSVTNTGLEAFKIPLGYMNTQRWGAVYLTRIPSRQGKQGLHTGNVFVPSHCGRNLSNLLQYQEFADSLRGHYPKKDEAVARITTPSRDEESIAFSRRFAVSYDGLEVFKLHFRGKPIATGYEPDRFRLPSHLQFLREIVQEQGIRVA